MLRLPAEDSFVKRQAAPSVGAPWSVLDEDVLSTMSRGQRHGESSSADDSRVGQVGQLKRARARPGDAHRELSARYCI